VSRAGVDAEPGEVISLGGDKVRPALGNHQRITAHHPGFVMRREMEALNEKILQARLHLVA